MIMMSPVSCISHAFSFYRIFWFIYMLFFDKSNSLNEYSGEVWYDSGSSGTYYFRVFSFPIEKSVVGVLESDVFAPVGVESIASIFASNIFLSTEVNSKCCQLLAIFWHSNSLFSFQISKPVFKL